jgi:hypothetical protein
MRYFAAAGVGVLAAIATSILWILVRLVLPIVLPFLISRTTAGGPVGVGAASAAIGSRSILLARCLDSLRVVAGCCCADKLDPPAMV